MDLTKLGGGKIIPAMVTSGKATGALTSVWPAIETMPLERAAEAYDKMMRGEVRFCMVLTSGL